MIYLFSLLIVGLLLLSWKYILRLEPAGVFAALWITMGVCTLLVENYINLNFQGCSFIMAGVIFFVTGTAFSDYFYTPSPTGVRLEMNQRLVTPTLLLFIAGAMVNPIYSLILHGFSLQALLDMREVLEMNKEISIERYNQGEARNVVSQFFLIFSYAAPIIGGFCFRVSHKWNRILCVITLIPGTFIALTQSLKMGMITSFMLWFGSYITCSYSYGLPIRLKLKTFMRFVYVTALLFLVLFVSMVFRYGEISDKTIFETSQKFVSYALGHMHNVDRWYTTYIPQDLTWGSRTFFGISNVLGLEERVQGIYPEFMNVGKNGFFGISNTFTIFRPLVEDFGEVGAMIFMFGMGLVSNMAIKAVVVRRFVYFNQTLLIAVYAFLMWSFSASFYAYTSYLATFALIYLLFRILQRETAAC